MSKDKEGSFISHLTELRKRLINSFIFLAILFVICYYFSEYIYGFLVEPYANAVKDDDTNRRLIFTACLLYTSPSPRDRTRSRMPSSA